MHAVATPHADRSERRIRHNRWSRTVVIQQASAVNKGHSFCALVGAVIDPVVSIPVKLLSHLLNRNANFDNLTSDR